MNCIILGIFLFFSRAVPPSIHCQYREETRHQPSIRLFDIPHREACRKGTTCHDHNQPFCSSRSTEQSRMLFFSLNLPAGHVSTGSTTVSRQARQPCLDRVSTGSTTSSTTVSRQGEPQHLRRTPVQVSETNHQQPPAASSPDQSIAFRDGLSQPGRHNRE